MKNRVWASGLLAAALCMGGAGEALASFPTGVWVKVNKVVYDNPADPTTAEIHGAIMVYDGSSNTKYLGYTEPAMGYLYYTCPAGQKATCQMEWKELENNIALPANECAGFGDQMTPPGKLRDLCEMPAGPDEYPIVMGVVSGFSPCQVISEYLATNPSTMCMGSSSSSSGGGGSAGAAGSGGTAGMGGAGGSAGAGGKGGNSAGGNGGSAGSAGNGDGNTGNNGNNGSGGGCAIGGAGGGLGALTLGLAALGAAIARRRRGGAPSAR